MLAPTCGAYRDGPWRQPAAAGSEPAAEGGEPAAEQVHGDGLDTPVDYWWWLAFFHAGKRCGKLDAAPGEPPLFGWRQHPRQHTRTHGRLSLANLRRIKVHFLLRRGGPADGRTRVIVLSTGGTLSRGRHRLSASPPPGVRRKSLGTAAEFQHR